MTGEPLLQFKSHVEGKNADVTIWPDRIEWAQLGKVTMTRLTAAAVTGGKVGMRKGSDTNVLPIRAVQGVSTHRAGIGYTTVEVVSAGDRVGFRISKDLADQVKETILMLMREPEPSPSSSIREPTVATSLADELSKLSQLRDQGVLSDEEFIAQKARLLG